MSITRVAKLAGVSVATVSRYINNTSYVADATRRRIQDAMDGIGYVPRALRPGPKRKERRGVRTGSVMLLSVDPVSPLEMWRMPALPTLLGGVQAAVEEKGLSLLLAHCPDGRLVPPALAASKVDGVLVVGRCGELSAGLRSALDRLPVVWLFRTHNDPELRYDHVLYDNREVGPIAARYLHGRGHRKVALVNPDPSHEAYRQRCESFVRVASEVGMAVLEHHADQPLQGPQQLAYFEDMLRSYTHSPEPPTALFCLADDRMLAVFHALRREEFRALAEMELIGCNNDPLFMDQMHTRPATIDIHLDLVGREAGNLLWQRFGEGGKSASLEVFIKPRLVEADCG